ncbi:hypothetical protein [Thermomonas sp.]|uniref:hypothetical protein n=1 Tax=Thermomonas sp. TaxID=1971895 RepID=UPI0026394700|nr:hypothetical protein [Thermomonas sp.]MCO5054994.1 hypothetical protein [Thermomonas sp.]
MTIFPGSAFRWFSFDGFTAPRRPRHRLLRALAGFAGIVLLLLLLVLGVFVGAAMLLGGVLWRALTQRHAAPPPASDTGVIDGSFRVVDTPRLPLPR